VCAKNNKNGKGSCELQKTREWRREGAEKKRKGKREEQAANMMMTAKSYSLEPEREKKTPSEKRKLTRKTRCEGMKERTNEKKTCHRQQREWGKKRRGLGVKGWGWWCCSGVGEATEKNYTNTKGRNQMGKKGQ